MSAESGESVSFATWISRPQSIIALAAVVLSVCGLFIAIYEAALIRREQRASVWPYLEVGASVEASRFEIRVRNTGVGPARVHAAAVSVEGETVSDWADLLRRAGSDAEEPGFYYSLIRGRVLPRDSESEVIFRVTDASGEAASALIESLSREMMAGRLDVTVCYCSVYEECWTSRLQDLFQRSRAVEIPVGDASVASCDRAPRSAI